VTALAEVPARLERSRFDVIGRPWPGTEPLALPHVGKALLKNWLAEHCWLIQWLPFSLTFGWSIDRIAVAVYLYMCL
jgi:hypothetical protein